ncbi:MAG: thiamine-binding protein [bacterium]|nr:thiamine-binding protein [bacterium]MDT8365387.1 thiamine-binding protein [bacterium]
MNKISAHMSVYPLRQTEVSPGIGAALDALADNGVEHEVGLMGTMLWGEDEKVFKALLDAFRKASSVGKTTLVVTISNATPWPAGDE